MSKDWQDDVWKFHVKMDLETNVTPVVPSEDTIRLRIELIKEEVNKELLVVLDRLANTGTWDSETFPGIMAELADSMADSIYVILGTAVSCGIDLQPIWNAVQRANMLKAGGPVRVDGKRLKPPGWKHPDIQKLIEEQTR